MQAFERWHLRVLGAFWALCGLGCLPAAVWRGCWWEQETLWIPLVVGTPFIVVGCGFALGRVWARWCMVPLMFGAGLVCLEGLLCGRCFDNPTLVWLSVAGLAMVGYTTYFTLFSLCKVCHDYV